MRSRAHFKGHPLHPILIAFPIAFLYGGLLADLLARLFPLPNLSAAGAYASVAAVVTGLVAGVPGFIDYLYVVPPNSTAKRRATWHMAVNLTALALVAAGAFFRDWSTFAPSWPTVLLELAGAALVTWGGWMGGTLVYRNQIGVDHRYAHAGKWHEVELQGSPGETVAIPDADAMKPGQMWLLRWNDRRLVLARTDDGYAAFDDRCTHRGASLADGALVCSTVQCPWHGSHFDVCTGAVTAGPAESAIATYPARLEDGTVRVLLPSAQAS